MISGKKTFKGTPIELDPLMSLANSFRWTGSTPEGLEAHMAEHPDVYGPEKLAEWQRFKASSFYPDRFNDWSDERMKELGFENYDGPCYE